MNGVTVIKETIVKKAKKKHLDCAYELICESERKDELTPEELNEFERVKSNGGFIVIGDSFTKQKNTMDGEIYDWCANTILLKACKRLNLFEE